ncbi:MAG: Uma2 family endonuclease [Acidobacteria bacterium]|nr:Uma2 family endonuclease [Acidobacteriota bacterium]
MNPSAPASSLPLPGQRLPAPRYGRAMTAEELFRLPDDNCRHELVRGELRRMAAAGFRHGAVIMNVAVPLGHHVKQHGLGLMCGAETGFVLERDPDTVLAPDVAFVRRDRIPASGLPAAFWEGPPDLAVEVTSPGDTRREVADKVASWLAAGTRLVWVVDPKRTMVEIHGPDGAPRRLERSDVLEGEPLFPGFRLPVTDIFGLTP